MQTRDYFILWISELEQAMNDLRHSFSYADDSDIASKLLVLKNELSYGQEETARIRNDYKGVVNDFFQRLKPFPSNPKTFSNDIKTYIDLVGHTIVLDDLSFLKKWGVEYPASKDFRVLAKPVSEYLDTFNNGVVGKVPQNALPYFRYLADELSYYQNS
jgi:hypothetical protein